MLREPWVLQLAEPAMLPQLPATGLPTDPSAYSGAEVITGAGPDRKENLCQGEGGGGVSLYPLLYMPMGSQTIRSTVLTGTPVINQVVQKTEVSENHLELSPYRINF